jgi:N-acetylglutamate synthase-like GNAT family acetyltransferase
VNIPPGKPEFHLRQATAADDNAIRALIRAARINPFGLDWRRFLLAVGPDGALLGCGQIKPHADGTFELASIAVEEGHRSRGIARAIIERLLAYSPRPLYLMCRSELGGLYGKFGFSPVPEKELPRYFRRICRVLTLGGRVVGRDGPLIMRLG